ncbi:hypothetical protein PS691_03171 [Pseudomonas fluorescens]|uniref:Uncharacterized protein n=1 Tax=Pseudomonas fluorescens TaxID=294 RepID=A0A5E7CSM9_PSEFL|nr:hypothetical protein PS691_03171 [Pseudomonas fluorescens]
MEPVLMKMSEWCLHWLEAEGPAATVLAVASKAGILSQVPLGR